MGRLWLGSEPHVVGRLGSGPGSGGVSPGVFSMGGLSPGELTQGGLSPRIRQLIVL